MKVVASIAAVLTALAAGQVAAAERAGEAMAVIDQASASGTVGKRSLTVGSQVFIGDEVATDSVGEAQLLFNDGTRMVVGSNSSLVIDQFLFRGNAAENKFAVRALGGAFRFISGDAGDKNYSIRTPAATIGVRGTAFDFTVGPGGQTSLVLLRGAATLCAADGDCAFVSQPCGLVRTAGSREVEAVRNNYRRTRETRKNFPYLRSQSSLLAPFKLAGQDCASDAADAGPAPDNGHDVEAAAAPAEPATGPGDGSPPGGSDGSGDGSSGGGGNSGGGDVSGGGGDVSGGGGNGNR